jgi:hypothetical protein
MYFNISKLLCFSVLFLGINQMIQGQPSAKISGVGHGRPGFNAGFKVEIIPGGISGPVRLKLDLPKEWKAVSYGFDKRATLQEIEGRTTLLWLSLPVLDTVNYSFDVRIPKDQAIRTETIGGVMEYFNSDGKKQTITISPHQIKLMKYYSRYQ